MKCLFIACVVAFVANFVSAEPEDIDLKQREDPKYLKMKEECSKESGLAWPEPSKNSTQKRDKKDFEKVMCFVRCLYRKRGVIRTDGTIDYKIMKERLSGLGWIDEGLVESTMECAKKVDKITTCQDVRLVTSCYPKPQKVLKTDPKNVN